MLPGKYLSSLLIKKETDTHLELNYLSPISNDSSNIKSFFSFRSKNMKINTEMLEMKVKKEYIKSQLNRFQKIVKKIELDKWLDTPIVSSNLFYTTFRTIKRGAYLKKRSLY